MVHINKEYSTHGTHVICDMHGIKPELLDNINYLTQLGRFSIAVAKAQYVGKVEKKFSPHGATILFLLEESHLSFHSFIEDKNKKDNTMLSVDMYCCGDADPNKAVDYIIKELQPDPKRVYRQTIIRGVE